MKYSLIYLISLMVWCSSIPAKTQDHVTETPAIYQDVVKENYEVSIPESGGHAVLVLFGGFPQRATDIKREFGFLELAKKHQLTILYMNYSRKLWLSESDKKELSDQLVAIFEVNNLRAENVHIGGFSSGGNIALLLSNYLASNQLSIQPKGVFVVDPPVDLLELYRLSQRNINVNIRNLLYKRLLI